ncbi:Nucleolar protein 9 [Lithohypha guttulata]|uniref:Nucleolar protein 9 n=1 Tax=Lithohypha guttulata TaxID=1690604 RepID=UPI002DE19D4D|nr:Nucleolar protein 9 [Lithohypha guttulata]KAK5105490.1 Nucleolar protein 9 [Lithohypha guttulata]
MPKELKKRGRRAENQRRQAEVQEDSPAKRRKIDYEQQAFAPSGGAGDDYIPFEQDVQDETGHSEQTTTFYGLLTEEEQEYYANVNNKIIANDFEDESDRNRFIEAVHQETSGKEIKVASSQSCSRYMEKIIRLSTPSQLRSLFQAFQQDMDYLIQHRFGSHCVETLFLQAAKYVQAKPQAENDLDTSFESLFLEVEEKLRANSGFLLTERFASHTVRVLLLVLSGQPLEDASAKDVIASRNKEELKLEHAPDAASSEPRKVPKSFKKALRAFVHSAISSLDTNYLRALATSPTGSPVLQLLTRLELVQNEEDHEQQQLFLQKLIPDQDFEPESDSSKFVSSLVYDSTGAYLVQTLVRYLPGKMFKKMYKNLFRDRIGKLAKNEIASYVAVSIFERVGKDDLAHAAAAMVPELENLVERNRLAVIRSLVERCEVRGGDLGEVGKALLTIYGSDQAELLQKMLKLNGTATNGAADDAARKQQKHSPDIQGSLLAQAMLRTRQLSAMVHDSLLAQEQDVLLQMAKNATSSHVIQVALTSDKSPNKFLRQFVPKFYNIVSDLAVDPSGSHVVDALWHATEGSHFMKERLASLLQAHEHGLRDSKYGRSVWKNWAMDVYQRRRGEWQALAKRQENIEQKAESDKPKKTAIELARERHMHQRGTQRNNVSTVKANG